MTDEGRSKHTGNGKWGRDDVPKRGWECTGVEDSLKGNDDAQL